MVLEQWASRWMLPLQALEELRQVLVSKNINPPLVSLDINEAGVQAAIRLEASRKGCRLWRNNVGAGKLENGSYIRWGLANDSTGVNKLIKSADLIGIRPIRIEREHVGVVIGQFLSREVKTATWKYAGTEREIAQFKWIELITALGGDACFATGEGTL